jgi:hypothetical protein
VPRALDARRAALALTGNTTPCPASSSISCAFETHAVDEIRAILDGGFDIGGIIKGRPTVTHLFEMDARSDAQRPDLSGSQGQPRTRPTVG